MASARNHRWGLAAVTAVVLCLGNAVALGANDATLEADARLTKSEVISIARIAAEEKGYRLKDYEEPKVHYEFTKKDKSWSVSFQGKVLMLGHHFWVRVDDRTGATTVTQGQ